MTDLQTIQHPAWCDPRMCEIDEDPVSGHHYQQDNGVQLSLHDSEGDYRQFVATCVDQRPTDAAPTLGLWSESVGNDARLSNGFMASMTRDEFIALHAAMGRVIDATA